MTNLKFVNPNKFGAIGICGSFGAVKEQASGYDMSESISDHYAGAYYNGNF